jgi:hypothetical protein
MTNREALQLVDSVTAQTNMSRDGHAKIIEALKLLLVLVESSEATAPEKKSE